MNSLRDGIQSNQVVSHKKSDLISEYDLFPWDFFTFFSMPQVFQQSLFLFLLRVWLHGLASRAEKGFFSFVFNSRPFIFFLPCPSIPGLIYLRKQGQKKFLSFLSRVSTHFEHYYFTGFFFKVRRIKIETLFNLFFVLCPVGKMNAVRVCKPQLVFLKKCLD